MENLLIKNRGIRWQQRIAGIEKNYTSRLWRKREKHFKNNYKVKKENFNKVKIIMKELCPKAKQ